MIKLNYSPVRRRQTRLVSHKCNFTFFKIKCVFAKFRCNMEILIIKNCLCYSKYLGHVFNVLGSVHPKNIPIYIQQDATLHSLFISGKCSTCFVWYLHPLSGAQTTVSTASGICHTVTVTCRCGGR
jgi:hypothetical protein